MPSLQENLYRSLPLYSFPIQPRQSFFCALPQEKPGPRRGGDIGHDEVRLLLVG